MCFDLEACLLVNSSRGEGKKREPPTKYLFNVFLNGLPTAIRRRPRRRRRRHPREEAPASTDDGEHTAAPAAAAAAACPSSSCPRHSAQRPLRAARDGDEPSPYPRPLPFTHGFTRHLYAFEVLESEFSEALMSSRVPLTERVAATLKRHAEERCHFDERHAKELHELMPVSVMSADNCEAVLPAVPSLVQLLKLGGGVSVAASILLRLSRICDAARDAVREAGAIPPLVALLWSTWLSRRWRRLRLTRWGTSPSTKPT